MKKIPIQRKKKGKKQKGVMLFFGWLANEDTEVRTMYTIAGIALCLAVLLGGWFFVSSRQGDVPGIILSLPDDAGQEGIDEDCSVRRGIDGVCLADEADPFPALVGVMIENHIEARPLSGIGSARLVYEAPVEGNITRLLAFFLAEDDVSKVGPVRSARPYYLDWVDEFGAPMYMHVGGSPDALSRISSSDMFDVNEFFRGWYFWRSDDRRAPHNTYTSSKLWQKAWDDYGDSFVEKRAFYPWQFANIDRCEEDCAGEVDMIFSGNAYAPTWTFNSSTSKYERTEFGRITRDRESGEQIAVDTLIVQRMETTVLDSVGRLGMETVGSGEAIIFQNGHAIEGVWQKGRSERTTFFEQVGGKEIPIGPGKIWIAVVPQTGDVTWK